jgi:hypothetical protein
MAGYRENSGFDPLTYAQPGPPLRPFNSVQRTGVAMELDAIAAMGYFVAVIMGKLPDVGINGMFVAIPLQIVGFTLVNSRRAPGTPAGSEQLRRNRKVLLITTAIVVPIVIAAAAIDFLGAK